MEKDKFGLGWSFRYIQTLTHTHTHRKICRRSIKLYYLRGSISTNKKKIQLNEISHSFLFLFLAFIAYSSIMTWYMNVHEVRWNTLNKLLSLALVAVAERKCDCCRKQFPSFGDLLFVESTKNCHLDMIEYSLRWFVYISLCHSIETVRLLISKRFTSTITLSNIFQY